VSARRRRLGSNGDTSQGWSGHELGCTCTRCVGFTAGPNGTAITRTTHGARSLVEIGARASEVADGIRETLEVEGAYRPVFEPAIAACAIVLVRMERAARALDEADDTLELESHLRLRSDMRGWANVARGYLNDLGCTPSALARISKDLGLAKATRAQAAMRDLAEHLEREHAELER
jgi:hypothetical protein